MIDFQFPPTELTPAWSVPTDTDLTQISLCCHKLNVLFDAYAANGVRIRQMESSDGTQLVADTNASITQMLDNLTSPYED